MHQEAEQIKGERIAKSTWRELTILLLKKHQYHTDYGREKLQQGKEANVAALMAKSRKKPEELAATNGGNKKPERGVDTMFRITSANNQRLSDMADNKANILLTVNSIILSMVVAVLVRKLDSNDHLIIPTFLLMSCVVITMVFSILSTIPKIPSGRFKEEDIQNKTVNLLFFGNFYKMNLQAYQAGMGKVMDDAEFLYGMLTKDVYSQGVVLGRKYKLLRYAYGIFMFGLVLSAIAFILAVVFI